MSLKKPKRDEPRLTHRPRGLANLPWFSRVQRWYLGKGPVWRFAFGFGFLMAVYYVAALLPLFDGVLFPVYLHLNALISNTVLRWLGQDSVVAGVTIKSAKYAVTIRRGCDAIEPAWFFCAGVISFPSRFWSKIAGILIGTTLLQALNVIRISSLFLVGLYWPGWFGALHLEIWPVAFIIAAMICWLSWVARVRRVSAPPVHVVA